MPKVTYGRTESLPGYNNVSISIRLKHESAKTALASARAFVLEAIDQERERAGEPARYDTTSPRADLVDKYPQAIICDTVAGFLGYMDYLNVVAVVPFYFNAQHATTILKPAQITAENVPGLKWMQARTAQQLIATDNNYNFEPATPELIARLNNTQKEDDNEHPF